MHKSAGFTRCLAEYQRVRCSPNAHFGGRFGFAIAPVFAIDPPGIRIVSVSMLDHYLALLEVRRSMHSGYRQMGECLWECADLFAYPQYCLPQ